MCVSALKKFLILSLGILFETDRRADGEETSVIIQARERET